MAGPTTWGYQVLGFGAGKKPASGGATTTKVQVTIAQFDEENSCACSLSSTTEVWENDMNEGGGDLTLSVGTWVGGQNGQCGQVTALNASEPGGGVDDYTASDHVDCDDCNDMFYICEDMGGP